jgi:hypothetical protein
VQHANKKELGEEREAAIMALLCYGGGSEGKGANDSKIGLDFITSPRSLFKSSSVCSLRPDLAFQVNPDPDPDPGLS